MKGSNLRKFEIIAVVITAGCKFLFYDILNQQLLFILLMFGFWGMYITWRIKHSNEVLKMWGFRSDNFHEVLRKILPFGLVAVVACFLIGFILETINIHWHIIPVLILYPLFGTLQQFLLMSLVAGNIQSNGQISNLSNIILTSILFGLLHYPYGWLMLGTFILSLLYTYIFLQNRNLYVLGVFHGWLGAIFYYTVVDQDPFIEVFGPYLN